jgi:hypothetical protein
VPSGLRRAQYLTHVISLFVGRMSQEHGDEIFVGGPTCGGGCTDWCASTKWRITTKYIERTQGNTYLLVRCNFEGVCCPKVDNVQILRVSDIHYSTNCCCDNCGVITIYSKDPSDPLLLIKGLPNGRHVYEKIRDSFNSITNNARLDIQQ